MNRFICLTAVFSVFITRTIAAEVDTRYVQTIMDNWDVVVTSSKYPRLSGVSLPLNLDDYFGYRMLEHGNLHGEAVFKNRFHVPDLNRKLFFLRFEGVGTYADITLNGHYIGHYDIGRTTENIEITKFIHIGEDNDLQVIVSHPAGITDMPWVCGGCSSEWGFSEGSQPFGIYRPVVLEATDSVRIEPFGVHIWNNSNCDSLFVETEIKNYMQKDTEITLVNTLFESDGKQSCKLSDRICVKAGETMIFRQTKKLSKPILWSTQHPYLYTLKTDLRRQGKVTDSTENPYGFSAPLWPYVLSHSPSARDKGDHRFYLNGQPVFINGVGEYEHLFGQSHAFSNEQIEARVKLVKTAGFNAFRDAHQPHNLYYKTLIEKQGLLWWPQFSSHIWYDTPEFRNSFKKHLRQWVKERRNSPSIILWGLQNESSLPHSFAEECCEIIREMDPRCGSQRLITTCNGGEGADWNVVQNWSGTYGGDINNYGNELKQPDQLLNGEYGAWRTIGNHTGEGYSEERFKNLLMTKVRLAESVRDSVCGQFLWLLVSHDNPGRRQADEALRRIDKIGPVNYKGLLTSWEQPTDAFYAYIQHYNPQRISPARSIIDESVLMPADSCQYIYRLNCGGDEYQDPFGNIWLQDNKNWSDSWADDFCGNVNPLMPLSPYQASQTFNDSLSSGLFKASRFGRHKLNYHFPASKGRYRVELYFIEPWYRQEDASRLRLFDVAINDSTVIKSLDIWNEVGYGKPYKYVVELDHLGGNLRVSFPRVKAGQAVISAIAVARLNNDGAMWDSANADIITETSDSLLSRKPNDFIEVEGCRSDQRMIWDFNVGVAKVYTLRWNYHNPKATTQLHVKITDSKGTVYKDDFITFTKTGKNETDKKTTSITTGSQINAGLYHVILEGEGIASMTFGNLTIDMPSTNMNTEVWVSPLGNDEGDGTESHPFATLQKALSHVRCLRADAGTATQGDIHVIMRGGNYHFTSPLVITEADSGTPQSKTIIEAAEGESPVITGGGEVRGWKDAVQAANLPDIAQGRVWIASVPKDMHIRQFWVNGKKMPKASTFDDIPLPRLISVNKAKGELVIPKIEMDFSHPEKTEMTIIQDWVVNQLRLKSQRNEGDRTVLSFMSPESDIEFKRPWPILRADEKSFSNHMFYLSNALEFLNRPQEWYYDPDEGKLFYWPRFGEDKETIDAVVPLLETLVSIEGDASRKVSHVSFRGITFQHSTWTRPSLTGHVPLQAGLFLYDAYTDETARSGNVAWVGRPAAGIRIKDAHNIGFEDCCFLHMGSTALDFVSGTRQMTVRGCVFHDIGGSGILAGYFGDEYFEAHQAYNPTEKGIVCDSLTIDNNYIAGPASEDWGCLGICVGYASNVTISHNEICNAPYSAINMGWGWTSQKNCMHNNHIVCNYIHGFSRQMRDGGAIYTLSSQPGSSIERNRIEDAGDPQLNPVMWDMRHAQFDIYLDEGSDYFIVRDNWCERGEISKNKNGQHNLWGVNDNTVPDTIKEMAGLEKRYQIIRKKVTFRDDVPVDSIVENKKAENPSDYIAPFEGLRHGGTVAVDLNDDNRLDIVYSGGESHQVQNGGVRVNIGNNNFRTLQGIRRLHMCSFATDDLNGDGYMDIAQAGNAFWEGYHGFWLNDGWGHLSENRLSSSLDVCSHCSIADFNNDGLCDLFYAGKDNYICFQRLDRTFAEPVTRLSYPRDIRNVHFACADFNNDQSIDIFVLADRGDCVYACMFYNDGCGRFRESSVPLKYCGPMDCADVNNDGWVDVVVCSPKEHKAVLYLADQKGQFLMHQEFNGFSFGMSQHPARFCDWDNDGHTDLIITGNNVLPDQGAKTRFFLNDGEGLFCETATDILGATDASVELADMDGDGSCDFLICGLCCGRYRDFTDPRNIAMLYHNQNEDSQESPKAPTSLQAEILSSGSVRLRWRAAQDSGSSTGNDSYNYYLRNESTGQYLIFPDSDILTGQRRVSKMGNAWLNQEWTIHNLPAGSYAWSVQAVKPNYVGSPFAKEQRFCIEY